MEQEFVELVPGELYRLGGKVALDGRISWAPPTATGWECINYYLLVNGDSAVLIDTGIALHAEAMAEKLAAVLAPGTHLSVYLTRMEADTVTGLGAVLSHARVDTVWAGGTANPFDYFDDLNSSEMMRSNYQAALRRLPGETLSLGEDRMLEVLTPPLRLLNTTWVYDPHTGTLFTSDIFGHTPTAAQDAQPVLDEGSDQVSKEQIRAHLLTKFAYLDGARTEKIIASLDALFNERAVKRIAPTQGCVLNDPATVARHVGLLRSILQEVGSASG